MPAYATHTIHAKECIKHIEYKIGINKDYLAAAAMAEDILSVTSMRDLFTITHKQNTNLFFIELLKYIKENNLRENPYAIAFLYGRIMHYSFDVKIHPFIDYLTYNHPAKLFKFNAHLIFEFQLADYIAKEHGIDPKSNYPFKNSVSTGNIGKMIDDVYYKVYKYPNVFKGYTKGAKNLPIANRFLKFFYNPKDTILPINEMLNIDKNNFTHPVTGELINKSFMELYDESIDWSIHLINHANLYLYDQSINETKLDEVFRNLSHNTGLDCNDKRPMTYAKRYNV